MTNRDKRRPETTAERKTRQFFWTIWAITVAGITAVTVAVATAYVYYPPAAVDRFLAHLSPWLAAWRLALFAVLIGGWPRWCRLYARWACLNRSQLEAMLAYRWRMAIWLLVMEAVFVHDVPGEFFRNLAGSGSF